MDTLISTKLSPRKIHFADKMNFWSKATGVGQSMHVSFLGGKVGKFRHCKAERGDFLSNLLVYVSAFAVSLQLGNILLT